MALLGVVPSSRPIGAKIASVQGIFPRVMAVLGTATHDLRCWGKVKSWVAGPGPAMTHMEKPVLTRYRGRGWP
jgi:hypothetical protein